MAISKRTRYDVLRRDNFACRYCGTRAPSVELHVDHVIPKSLGGSDDGWNLTAACAPCNLGKNNSAPTDTIIMEVRRDQANFMIATGRHNVPCEFCGTPIACGPDEYIQYPQCDPCNDAVSDAYQHGFEAGKRFESRKYAEWQEGF